MTGKQRMLNAYRGEWSDRAAIGPEFWVYYPAKLLGVDMIEFARDVPFHMALKNNFEVFECEGWGATFAGPPNPDVTTESTERWIDDGRRLEIRSTTHTPAGDLTSASLLDRAEPGWSTERPIKDLERDLPAFEIASLPDPEGLDPAPMIRAWEEVGDSYLLEGWLGAPFFDFFAGSREGGFPTAIYDLLEREDLLLPLRERFVEWQVRLARVMCERTPLEALVFGNSWSNNSLLGPALWRQWDKPGMAAVCEEVHRHGKLLHVHYHGKCRETVADFAEIGFDAVCPFERPPGGDIVGLEGLLEVRGLLDGKVAMVGNVHTVETLIRGTEADVRREVGEIWEAFGDTPRLVISTGDQVGRETPEENLHAMIDEAKRLSAR